MNSIDCQICVWNPAIELFDDELYSKAPSYSDLFLYYELTGYNWVINPNSYNPIYVCNECLLKNVYMCDYELKIILLTEYMVSVAFLESLANKLPNDLIKLIRRFI